MTSKIKNCRHFVMIGGILIAILGSALVFALPTTNKVGRLLSVPCYVLASIDVQY